MDTNRFVTYSLHDASILRILAAALEAVDPFAAVQKHLPNLDGQVYGLSLGKAALPMLDALSSQISLTDALAVTKFTDDSANRSYRVLKGGHPVPDERSVQAGHKVLDFVKNLGADDTLVCLISGGASALVSTPVEGVSLADLQALTSHLLASGARIDEINTIRRHLDQVKGGGLARATSARILSLILSDVIDSPLEVIASGPTAPDPTTKADALKVLENFVSKFERTGLLQRCFELLNDAALSETLKPGDAILKRVENRIIGDNALAAQAAQRQAQTKGFECEVLTNSLQGEARQVGRDLATRLRIETQHRSRPFCLIAGGETTVTLRGAGKGGRNQELALGAVEEMSGLEDGMLIALATDGDDGPTDAAGAVVTGQTLARAHALNLDPQAYLGANDAYPFFSALNDLLKTGSSGTNVNDLNFLFGNLS